MHPRPIAVIDLGTNTFHLLIVRLNDGHSFTEIFRKRFFIKLAEEGIATISEAAYQRGIAALHFFRQKLDEYKVQQVTTFGTAALRTASNGSSFIQQIREETNIHIELIDGNREAELIYKGVRLAVPFKKDNFLIMDIGGGSVEFIIANEREVQYAQSFPIGVAVLYKKFHQQDPIQQESIQQMEQFLEEILQPLEVAMQQYATRILVGASGTFDVLDMALNGSPTSTWSAVDIAGFIPIYEKLLKSTLQERLAMPVMPEHRADMIVVAVLLIHFIIQKFDMQKMLVSSYALKEGVIAEQLRLPDRVT